MKVKQYYYYGYKSRLAKPIPIRAGDLVRPTFSEDLNPIGFIMWTPHFTVKEAHKCKPDSIGIVLDDTPKSTEDYAHRYVKIMAEGKIGYVCIDYLRLFSPAKGIEQ